jgi:hypothetical protein
VTPLMTGYVTPSSVAFPPKKPMPASSTRRLIGVPGGQAPKAAVWNGPTNASWAHVKALNLNPRSPTRLTLPLDEPVKVSSPLIMLLVPANAGEQIGKRRRSP